MNNYTIGDAHQETAFLTNQHGYDIAKLVRYTADDFSASPEHVSQLLGDDEWQKLINVVAAAPALLSALQKLHSRFTDNCDGDEIYGDWIAIAEEAINKAEAPFA